MYNLCCIANELKPSRRFMAMTWLRYTQLGNIFETDNAFAVLSDRWLNNVQTTYHTMEHCFNNGWGYRVSSSLFPVLTHPDFKHTVEQALNWSDISACFDQICQANQKWKIRLSVHPDQFNVLASNNQRAVDKTIQELNLHGWLLDQLGCSRTRHSPINIHINSTAGEPTAIVDRFMANLARCDTSVTSRLVIENEDKGMWNVATLLEHFGPLGIPITFDNLHHRCNPSIDEREAMLGCAATWGDVRPIFHYSESDVLSKNPRVHANLPTGRPVDFDCDWDVELKDKEGAIRMLAESGFTGPAIVPQV